MHSQQEHILDIVLNSLDLLVNILSGIFMESHSSVIIRRTI